MLFCTNKISSVYRRIKLIAMAENKRKSMETPLKEEDRVKLRLKSNKYGKEVHLMVKRKAKLRSILVGFCRYASLDYRSTRFVIHHRNFNHYKTPNQLGLEDGDQIDALIDGNGA